jgi:putative spermidine/putrescine transport system permease protein
LVRTYAWQVILRDTGIINQFLQDVGIIDEPFPLIRTTLGVTLGMAYIMLPFMVLLIYAGMRQIDPTLGRAAATLGASPRRAFVAVFLPLSLGGIAAGSLLVFVQSLGFFITPALLGSPQDQMFSQAIVVQASERLNWGYASTMSLILLALTFLVLLVAMRFVRVRDVYGVGTGDVLR